MKMLKRIFGVVTVSVAFGVCDLKATFEQDLQNVCKKYEINPVAVNIFLEFYKSSYQEFKGKVVVKMRKLHNLCPKKKRLFDDGSVFCPGKSEIEMLQFAEWLWKQVKNYEMEAKKVDCWHDAVKYECYDAFVRRMCNFGFACIRFLAGRFASEEILFNKKDIESEEKVIDGIMESFPASMRDYIKKKTFCNGVCLYRVLFICDRKNAKWGWKEYTAGIYERCWGVLDHAKGCRLYLEKFSDQDFDKINALWKSVKGDANVLREDYEIREEIDKLKKEKERVVYELHEGERFLEYFEK